MAQVSIIGLDLAKNVFQVHVIDAKVLVRRSLCRAEVLAFFAKLSPCLVGTEACGTAHVVLYHQFTLSMHGPLIIHYGFPPSYTSGRAGRLPVQRTPDSVSV